MYSVLMTGYMFRNAQYRMELQQSLEQIALPEPKEEKVLVDQCLAYFSPVVVLTFQSLNDLICFCEMRLLRKSRHTLRC
jgi:hypothetical protein